MRKEIESSLQWGGEFSEVLRHVTDARNIIENRKPSDSLDPLMAVYNKLTEIKQICDNLKYYFCRNSIDKWVMGQELSREEFYLLAAQGVLLVPSESGLQEAYEEYAYYLYEDNDRKGYIIQRPDPPPTPTGKGGKRSRVGIKVGVTPEDVRINVLKPEQKEFFKEHVPDLFARFRRD